MDGGSWQGSGTTVSALSIGIHTVSFKIADGGTAPASQSVSITANQTKTVTGTYTSAESYTLADAIRILQVLAGITHQEGEGYEDISKDGKAGLDDVIYILHYVAGI